MMTNETKSTEMQRMLDEIGFVAFGRSRTLAKAGSQCVSCGMLANSFRDDVSRKEYRISGLCQTCQDNVFDEAE